MKWISKIFRKGFFGKRSSMIKDFIRNPDDYAINIKSGIFMGTDGPTDEIRITIRRIL